MLSNSNDQPASPRRRYGCLRSIAVLFVLLLAAANSLAWMHARAATHFVREGRPIHDLIEQPLSAQLKVALTGAPIPRPTNRQTPADHYLPYEVHQIALPAEESLEAWFVPHPKSLGTVVMFGGYAGVKDGLLTPAALLYQFSYSSLLVDFRGAGGSSRDDTTIGMREAEDVAAAVAYVRQQWPNQPLILYGVSMGAAAILRAVAVEQVRPDGIIIEGVFDRFLSTVKHRFTWAGAPSFPAAELLVFWGSIQQGYNGFSFNPAEYATAVACPTLLMNGERDPWITQQEAQAVFDQLRGPKQFVQFPEAGHQMPFVYVGSELWKNSVREFLKSIPTK